MSSAVYPRRAPGRTAIIDGFARCDDVLSMSAYQERSSSVSFKSVGFMRRDTRASLMRRAGCRPKSWQFSSLVAPVLGE